MNDSSRYVLAALAALIAAPAMAAGPAADFDGGLDIRGMVRELRATPASEAMRLQNYEGGTGATKECAPISFRFGDPARSPAATLTSKLYRRTCRVYYGQEQCWDEVKSTVAQEIIIARAGPLGQLPWEREVFMACLEGHTVTLETLQAAHDYDFAPRREPGRYTVQATARKKLRTDPDPAGLIIESFGQDASGGLVLRLKDQWAAFYKGEKTRIRVTLRKEAPPFIHTKLFEGEVAPDAADAYDIVFSRLSPDVAGRLNPGDRVYVEWSFARPGKVSRDGLQTGGVTPRYVYHGRL